MKSTYFRTGGFLILIGIILGAFGRHWLKTKLSANSIESIGVGNQYLIYHGLALLILGSLISEKNRTNTIVFRLIITGISMFTGSIYFLSTTVLTNFPKYLFIPLTPIGGIILIFAWFYFIVQCNSFRSRK